MTVPVLLGIDVLSDFTRQHSDVDRGSLVSGIDNLARVVREAHGRIISVRQAFAADLHDAFLDSPRT